MDDLQTNVPSSSVASNDVINICHSPPPTVALPLGLPIKTVDSFDELAAKTLHLENGVMHVFLPTTDIWHCPVEGCDSAFRTVSWRDGQEVLSNHLNFTHGVRFYKTSYWCLACKAMCGINFETHPCFILVAPIDFSCDHPYVCKFCDKEFKKKPYLKKHLSSIHPDATYRRISQGQPSGATMGYFGPPTIILDTIAPLIQESLSLSLSPLELCENEQDHYVSQQARFIVPQCADDSIGIMEESPIQVSLGLSGDSLLNDAGNDPEIAHYSPTEIENASQIDLQIEETRNTLRPPSRKSNRKVVSDIAPSRILSDIPIYKHPFSSCARPIDSLDAGHPDVHDERIRSLDPHLIAEEPLIVTASPEETSLLEEDSKEKTPDPAPNLRLWRKKKKIGPPNSDCQLQQNQDDISSAPANSVTDPTWDSVSSHSLHRNGDSLNFFFPQSDIIACTESRCTAKFRSIKWTNTKKSLSRHLFLKHKIKITSSHFFCSHCEIAIDGRPTLHSCFSGENPRKLVILEKTQLEHQCPECEQRFLNLTALNNHQLSHRRNKVKEKENTSIPTSKHDRRAHWNERVRKKVRYTMEPGLQENVSIPTPILDEDVCPPLVLEYHTKFFDVSLEDPSEEQWKKFQDLLDKYCSDLRSIAKIKPRADQVGPQRKTNVEDPIEIQRLYSNNRPRAMRAILGQEGDRCEIPAKDIETHFTHKWSAKKMDPSFYSKKWSRPPVNTTPFSLKEVQDCLRATENTAPGPDQIAYRHLKKHDPDCIILHLILNILLKHGKIPPSLKQANVILIPKKGDAGDIGNWRPICLLNTIFKMFSKCLTRRLTAWISANDVLCKAQKGFLAHDGVQEHNFILQTLISDAKLTSSDILITWLDISDAFGSIPHHAISEGLLAAGAGEEFTNIIVSIYNESSASFFTSEGTTSSIPLKAGVRQGDPMSGILFNMLIDPLLRSIQGNSSHPRILAYADDLVIISPSPSIHQQQLLILEEAAAKISLSFNPAKCATLHISGQQPVGCRDTSFSVNGRAVKTLREGETQEMLGKPIGFLNMPSQAKLADFTEKGLKILRSKLKPWQAFDALRTFFFPGLQFYMRTQQFLLKDWELLDATIRREIKNVLYVPPEASNHYIYGPTDKGCCGVLNSKVDADIFIVDSAFKLLNSKDSWIVKRAMQDLSDTVARRFKRNISNDDISSYLTGDIHDSIRSTDAQYRNIWTSARMASRKMELQWNLNDNSQFAISTGEQVITPKTKSKLVATLRLKFKSQEFSKLLEKPSQGFAFQTVSKAKVSSAFIYNGSGLAFADWRFVHQARLNLNRLRGDLATNKTQDPRCRRCVVGFENLCHVINACRIHQNLWVYRHDAILHLFRQTVERNFEILSYNDYFEDTDAKPDIVFFKDDLAFVIDVCCPFENVGAQEKARLEKIKKYDGVAQILRQRFTTVVNDALIVSSLGSWDPANDRFVNKICSRTSGKILRENCVAMAIRWSRMIFMEHVSGRRQWSQQDISYRDLYKYEKLPNEPNDQLERDSSPITNSQRTNRLLQNFTENLTVNIDCPTTSRDTRRVIIESAQ